MPKFTVGTAAVQLVADGREHRPVVKNLGPGAVGLDKTNAVTVADASIHLAVGESFEWSSDLTDGGWAEVWAIADAAGTDVRVARVG